MSEEEPGSPIENSAGAISIMVEQEGQYILEVMAETDPPDTTDLLRALAHLRQARNALTILDDQIVSVLSVRLGPTGQVGTRIEGFGKAWVWQDSSTVWDKASLVGEIAVRAAEGDLDVAEKIKAYLTLCFNANPNFSVTGLRSMDLDPDVFREIIKKRWRMRVVADGTPDPETRPSPADLPSVDDQHHQE